MSIWPNLSGSSESTPAAISPASPTPIEAPEAPMPAVRAPPAMAMPNPIEKSMTRTSYCSKR